MGIDVTMSPSMGRLGSRPAAGMPLPRADSGLRALMPEFEHFCSTYSLFCADDGLLIERDRAKLQLMIGAVVAVQHCK